MKYRLISRQKESDRAEAHLGWLTGDNRVRHFSGIWRHCNTTSCWRRNAISASRAACDLSTPTSNPPSSFRRSIIPAMRVAHRGSCASPDAIFGSHRGGTTDFSLIAVTDNNGALQLDRISVVEQLLLGGDNMDLALTDT